MLPIDAYNDTAARARRMMRLHDGLINIRQRRIRSDWKASFCEIMHWNQSCEIERIDSADAVIILRDGATMAEDDFKQSSLDDLLRAAFTFSISALDRYVHERVVKGIVEALKKADLTRQQEEFAIPAFLAIRISESVARARQNNKVVRPANEVRKKVQELLHKRPFQSWREIEYAFNLLGITDLGGQLQTAYRIGDMKPVKDQLNKIVARRNIIVHEGDLLRHERGGQVKMHPITHRFVSESLTFLDDFVIKLDSI